MDEDNKITRKCVCFENFIGLFVTCIEKSIAMTSPITYYGPQNGINIFRLILNENAEKIQLSWIKAFRPDVENSNMETAAWPKIEPIVRVGDLQRSYQNVACPVVNRPGPQIVWISDAAVSETSKGSDSRVHRARSRVQSQ